MGCAVSKEHLPKENGVYIVRSSDSTTAETEKGYSAAILILGAPNSGKSTLFKQIRMIHNFGYQELEKQAYVPLIASNMAASLKSVLEVMTEERPESFDDDIALQQEKLSCHGPLSAAAKLNAAGERLKLIKKIWKDKTVQECFSNNLDKIKLPEAAQHFFKNIDRITKQGYVPDDQDILYAKLRTTGITDMTFCHEGMNLTVLDVGGQRSERRKWIHYFEGVDIIMYLASLTDYDQPVEEQPDKNAMEESVQIFASLIKSQWFRKSPVLLYLNKKDRFESKIKSHPLNKYIADFKENPESYDDSVAYIKDKFVSTNMQKNRLIYCRTTCATNKQNISAVLNVSLNNVLCKTFETIGL